MNDQVKNNAILTTFAPETVQKVPVLLHVKEDFGPMYFHVAFANMEILCAHLLKSDEWIYGIYYGVHYYGYLYFGEKLSRDLQLACVKDFLPESRDVLSAFVERWNGKVNYHFSAPDAFRYLGEYQDKKIYQKPKKLKDIL